MGVKFVVKKRYVTLEWPLTSSLSIIAPTHPFIDYMARVYYNMIGIYTLPKHIYFHYKFINKHLP